MALAKQGPGRDSTPLCNPSIFSASLEGWIACMMSNAPILRRIVKADTPHSREGNPSFSVAVHAREPCLALRAERK